MFGGETGKHLTLIATLVQGSAERFGDVEHVESMPPAQFSLLAARGQALPGVLADRLQHPEALARVPEEALVDQRLEGVQIGLGDLLCGLQRAAAGEDGQSGEQPLLVLLQQLVAPLDRRAQRPLAGLRVTAAP